MNTSPEVSSKEFWEGVLKSHWGIDAKLNSLPGELDQNFLAQEKNGSKYILKIMRTDCPDWLIKAQIESIEKINKKFGEGKIRLLANSDHRFFYTDKEPRVRWQMKSAFRSACYTTNWYDIPKVKTK